MEEQILLALTPFPPLTSSASQKVLLVCSSASNRIVHEPDELMVYVTGEVLHTPACFSCVEH